MYKKYIFLIFISLFLSTAGFASLGIDISPDGSLADWKGIRPIVLPASNIVYNRSLWHGPKDLSAKVYITSSERYLYIGLKVRDDSFIVPKNNNITSILRSDHIEIWIDTNPERKSKKKIDKYVHQFIFKLGKEKNCIELYPKKVFYIKTLKYAIKKTNDGYIFEAKIPGFLLNSPFVKLKKIGLLVDIVDVDRGDDTKQGTFLSLSSKRKWGKPDTFYKMDLSNTPLYTYKAYKVIKSLALYYSNAKFLDIDGDGIEDIVYTINYKDYSYVEIAHISNINFESKRVFSSKFPLINIYPEILKSKKMYFFTLRGETLTGYPVIEVFKFENNKLKNVGIIISKGIEVYPVSKDIDNDGILEIILSYKDGVRIYKYIDGRYRLVN